MNTGVPCGGFLWFFLSYQAVWLTPDELEREHQRGRFIFSTCNWQLRDPVERLAQYDEAIADLTKERRRHLDRMAEAA